MLIAKHYSRDKVERWKTMIAFAAAFLLMVIMAYLLYTKGFIFDQRELLGSTINPPGITLLLYAVTVMMSICFWDKVAPDAGVFNIIEEAASYIGKHTLYIFLYHRLFLDFFLNAVFGSLNIVIKIPLYYCTMVLGSMALEWALGICKNVVVQSYIYRKPVNKKEKQEISFKK